MSSNCTNSNCSSDSSVENKADESLNLNKVNDGFISIYHVPGMDCPSEESMIRMAYDNVTPAVFFKFDIPNRKVSIYHHDNLDEITARISKLGFGAKLQNTNSISADDIKKAFKSSKETDESEAVTIKWLLGINAFMFLVEIFVGFYAQSTGLIADALDMLADASVYALTFYAVGKSAQTKLKSAHLSGWIQIALALGVLTEVIRRFIYGSEPISTIMVIMGILALIANVTCLLLIFKKKDDGAHMKASWIFSANDVIANLGVILAGILVYYTQSSLPDLIIGFIIGGIVLMGARRILKLS